ncbi:uncharacterized protein LACBIDRAFT_331240 [Laccaria bicolor S238N-H82]|uniref:Predicted protein n=1 Tax=Laccaria bicolor (strain S238N-H82 / ATCC MYA-4686) TaxID=486041 RepID=B0DNW4_LACBS|nr:uncharacterized protein LACBIDRAFT_331240 [Laccaria bicolor S238N-H82]EDR03794.1 predicted protein [Laccaria bicolor S238N-H82]|eukprot:XP_001885647.1 predicted protein [Laccaria bicolor S238N-H82]
MGSSDFLSPLPLDLLLHLFSFLDPLHIIALRKTCRTLHEATLQRQVWLNTLRRVCVANSVFAPSFPLTEMTLLELEHAAVVPSLWRSIGSAKHDDQPYRTKRTLRGPTSHGDDGITTWGDTLSDLFLVPGGRYLILFFDHLMSVYDLGITPDTLLDCNTRLLASVEIQFKWLFLVHPSPDGSALRICVSDELAEDEDEQIGQSAQWVMSHNFSQVAQFLFKSDLFLRNDILTVWDFVADTSATWRVVGEFHQIIIASDSIILFGSTCVSVWHKPALLPRDRADTTLSYVDVPIIHPLFQIDYPECMPPLDDTLQAESSIQGPWDWYSTEPWCWCYDTVLQREAGFAISRYLVAFNKDMTGGTIKKTACYELRTTLEKDFFIEPYRVCHDQLVMSWTERSGIIKIHTSAFSQDTVTPGDNELALMLEEWKAPALPHQPNARGLEGMAPLPMETQVSGYIIIWHEAESLSPREIADLADVQFAVTKNPEGNRYNRSKHEITIHAVQTAVKDTVVRTTTSERQVSLAQTYRQSPSTSEPGHSTPLVGISGAFASMCNAPVT